ncbi:MAG: hypothetical protein PVSMB1_15080 [Gemmatimonadaceae bacterium]
MLEAVCQRHAHVIPVETFLHKESADEQHREIARQQQQARALQTEIEERKKLESALRDPLEEPTTYP